MVSANCQACMVGIRKLPQGVGNPSEPLGSCRSCHSLTCGHHGHRDPNVPEFICVECDPSLLAASAATMTTTRSAALDRVLAGYHLHHLPAETWRIESLDDFVRRRPGYGQDFFDEVRQRTTRFGQSWADTNLREAFSSLPLTAKELLVAAGLIIERFLAERPVAELLGQIRESLGWL